MKTTNYLTQTIAAVACFSRIANAYEETAQDLTIMDSSTTTREVLLLSICCLHRNLMAC